MKSQIKRWNEYIHNNCWQLRVHTDACKKGIKKIVERTVAEMVMEFNQLGKGVVQEKYMVIQIFPKTFTDKDKRDALEAETNKSK